ncbi:MAG: hypothetical protein V1747_09935 [Candidatus Omnitrophota bacterium]
MDKRAQLIKICLILYCLEVFIPNSIFAQQLPEQTEAQTAIIEESFTDGNVETLTIAADPDTIHLESMLSSEQLAETYAYAFDLLNDQGAEDIITAYLENGYSLSAIGEILKNASFSLEDTFKAMVNHLGEDSLGEIIGALLEAKFKSGDVFKVAINHLKQVSPELTDNQIIEKVLGTSVDPANLKSLMQEIFIEKISSVSDPIKCDLVIAMIDSGFSLNEITSALTENGFSIDQIAQIYSLGSIDIGLTYDLLLNTPGSQETDVIRALLASSYTKSEVFECIVNKLSGTKSVEQIVSTIMGQIDVGGPSDEQLNNAIVLSGVLHAGGISISEISGAFLSAGFNLDNVVAVLNGIGTALDDAFATLLGANGGQSIADVAAALISNGFDVHAVFALSTAEFKNQGVGLTQVVQALIGTIDPEKGPTKNQTDNSRLLVDVLLNADDSLQNIAEAFIANDFGLENTAKLFKSNGVSAVDTYNALVGATEGEYASVAVAMTTIGFTGSIVIELAVTDLKAHEFSNADIMSMLIGTVEEGKIPTNPQITIAGCLTKILIDQGVALPEIGENLISQGFNLNYTAKIFKKADVDITEAFSVMIKLDAEAGFDVVCADLKAAGYRAADIFKEAVTALQEQGHGVSEIINILITAVDSGKNATGAQINNAGDLVKYLISGGSASQEICEGLLAINFSLSDIAKVMRKTSVELDVVFAEILALGGGQDIGLVSEALIAGSYDRNSVFQIAIGELKAQDYSTAAIINTLIGVVDPEEGQSVYQKTNAPYLLLSLSLDGGNLEEICGGFLSAGFSLDEIASATKKVNIDLIQTYSALLNANGGQDSEAVINALNNAGYEISTLFELIVPELQGKDYSTAQIITFLIGNVNPVSGLSAKQLERAHILVYVLSETGESIENISTAMATAGFKVEDNAKILYRKIGDAAEAYNLLTSTYGQESVTTIALGMINAGYDIESVLNIIIPIFEDQELSMPDIISTIIGVIASENKPTSLQLKLAAKLTDIFTAKGNTIEEIAQCLFTVGIGLDNVAVILKAKSTEFDSAYSILTNLTQGQKLMDVAFALINSGFDNETVVSTVVDELKIQGKTNAEIINLFIGTVDLKSGLTDTQKQCALSLIKKLRAEEGVSLSSICNDLGSTGLTLEKILPLMKSAEISTEDTFNALLSFDKGQDPVELANVLMTNNYTHKEVFEALVNYLEGLGSEYSVNKIIEMVIGDIDAENGLSGIQLGYARDLANAFLANDTSLEVIATGFLNHGVTLTNTVIILKLAEAEAEETYTALMSAYVPKEDEVAIREITSKMISAGYSSFTVYAFAVKKLADQGITNEVEIVDILIGPVNSEDSQQLRNAGKLSMVINYNKAILTAQNTEESFIVLFKQGFTIEQITQMLNEGGVSDEQVNATFLQGFSDIVKELVKSGMSPESIVKLLINKDNKLDYVRPLAEQLRRNDFASTEVRSAFYSMPGGMYSSDWDLISNGLADADDYRIENTQEAQTINSMLNEGQTLTEISQHFAEQGYQMSFIGKLFKTLGQSIEEIFNALDNTKTFYSDDLLVNDTAASIVLLKYYSHKDVFTCATQYYKERNVNSEGIILKLMSSAIKVDSTNVIADTIVGEYYASKADIQTQSFVTLMDAGYSVIWIKDALLKKNFTAEAIEAFIQNGDNFKAIYQGLSAQGFSASNIVKRFEVAESPGEYTVLLAENMIKDGLSETEVTSILLSYKADPDLIKQGIARGLA